VGRERGSERRRRRRRRRRREDEGSALARLKGRSGGMERTWIAEVRRPSPRVARVESHGSWTRRRAGDDELLPRARTSSVWRCAAWVAVARA